MTAQRALRDFHSIHAVVVPAALLLSTGLLLKGLSLPLLYSQKLFWESTYSVWTGIVALWQQHEYVLASVLFFFSIVFPIVKLLSLAVVWFQKLPEEQTVRLLHWLRILGKWSMLDVFVVAILIVAVKLGPLASVEPRRGVYFFCLAILCSMFTTQYINRLAHSTLKTKTIGSA